MSLHVELERLRITGAAEVLHKPGTVRLDAYPLLVFAPGQHGPGIRTEDHGHSIEDVCEAACIHPGFEATAASFTPPTTVDHVRQAVAYALEIGYASREETPT